MPDLFLEATMSRSDTSPEIVSLMSGLGLKIEQCSIDALVPYAWNAKTHSDQQDALTVGSIRNFGVTHPILVDGSNRIIAGHGRLDAGRNTRELSADKSECVVAGGL